MRYQGGKSRISKQIAQVISRQADRQTDRQTDSEHTFVSLFCGSCAIESKVQGFDRVILNDKHKYLVALLKAVQNGWIPPDTVTEQQYRHVKDHRDESPALTGFVGFGCSFGGKWFGGYARNKGGTNYALQSKRSLMKDMASLMSAEFICKDYHDVILSENCVVYADPPYSNTRTIERYISSFSDELKSNGLEILRGKRLIEFIDRYNSNFAADINVGRKIRSLTVFDFRSFLNIAMLLSESEKARALRQMVLDIVIDIINRKTGGGTKYINQRDKDFVFASIQEENYRRQFTDSLKNFVVDNKFKYAHFTDMIYVSIFKEKAKEYKKILDLKASDKVRDTFYSEILDIIAAYESGRNGRFSTESPP